MTVWCVIAAMLHVPGVYAEEAALTPARSAQIEAKLNSLWREGALQEVRAYVEALKRKHPEYLPARVASATLAYREGAQAERLLTELESLRKDAVAHLKTVSPAFLLSLDGEIRSATLLRDALNAGGSSSEDRRTRFAPEVISPQSRAAGWGFGGLFASVPEVTLKQGGSDIVHYPPWSGRLAEGDTVAVAAVLLNPTRPRDERLRAAATLGMRAGSAPTLIRVLDDGDERLVTVAAESLSRLRSSAVPALLAVLASPAERSSNVVIHCMWALVRQGDANPEVISALRRVSASPSRPVSGYAREALNVLAAE